jgi:hypothetical protein
MEDQVLVQRYFLHWMKFEVISDGVQVTESSILVRHKYKIRFENISFDPEEVTVSSKFYFWATAALITLAIIVLVLYLAGQDVHAESALIWAILAAGFGVGYLTSRKRFYVYGSKTESGDPLVVYQNKPSKVSMERFIDEVRKHRQIYLRKHYLFSSSESSVENTIEKLNWLKNQNAITEEEYEKLKKDTVAQSGWKDIRPISSN